MHTNEQNVIDELPPLEEHPGQAEANRFYLLTFPGILLAQTIWGPEARKRVSGDVCVRMSVNKSVDRPGEAAQDLASEQRYGGPIQTYAYRVLGNQKNAPAGVMSTPLPRVMRRRRRAGLVALVATVVLAVLSSAYLVIGGNPFASHQPVLQLPANLSWSNYVLYYTRTRSGNDGNRYLVMGYHDMSSHQANLQYIIPGKMDIKVVWDQQRSLGLDMIHHIAQWDVEQWASVDLPPFDLQRLRQDLRKGQAIYEGKGRFRGQDVHRICYPGGYILLLNMQYMPVNVLNKSQQQEQPIYDTVRWFPPAQVASSLWDMMVPSDFTPGKLPPMPLEERTNTVS